MKASTNIYKLVRIRANMPQSDSAEELAVSRRCLADYESGNRGVPDDIVLNMMRVYKADYLGYLHLQNSIVGKIVLPSVNPEIGIAAVAIGTHMALIKLAQSVNDLLSIAEDDTVDSTELERFILIQQATKSALSALMSVAVGAFSDNKKRTVNSAKLTVQRSYHSYFGQNT